MHKKCPLIGVFMHATWNDLTTIFEVLQVQSSHVATGLTTILGATRAPLNHWFILLKKLIRISELKNKFKK
jgi:hypothetical protein